MLRAILGAVFGYIVMFAVVFVGLTVAWMAMGTDRVFEPGVYDATKPWSITSFAVGFVAAIAGGVLCAVIARRGSKAPAALAGVVLVLGLALGGWTIASAGKGDPPPPRTADTTMLEAMQHAKTPTWVCLVNPVVGAIGVLVGAAMTGRGKAVP